MESNDSRLEYSCWVIKLVCSPQDLPEFDNLGELELFGNPVLVRKDEFKANDWVIYAPIETKLNESFLEYTNSYRDSSLNRDKTKIGYIETNRRVKMIKLRGKYSMGVVYKFQEFYNWAKDCLSVDVSDSKEDGYNFNKVGDVDFVTAFNLAKEVSFPEADNSKERKRQKNVQKYEFMPEDTTFKLNYITNPIQYYKVPADKQVWVSIKYHGTSVVVGNTKLKAGEDESWLSKLVLGSEHYGVIYGNRTKLGNEEEIINNPYYGYDIWRDYYELLKKFVPKGTTIYGEICGYITNTDQYIQPNYDYGCEVGQNFVMIYRISENDGEKELTPPEVVEWTKKLLKEHPELEKKVKPLNLIFSGKFGEFFSSPSTPLSKEILEMDEPLCKNVVPREGICIRMEDVFGNYKLKSKRFYMYETNLIEKGYIDPENNT